MAVVDDLDGCGSADGVTHFDLASLDQGLEQLGLDYVNIFYSHRPHPHNPLEETMGALATAVQQGKALYAGISSYSPSRTVRAAQILADLPHDARVARARKCPPQ